jgi:hypothetical protein
MRKITVNIGCDQDTESPADHDCQWKPYSFGNRHNNYKDPREFIPPNIGLRRKLEVGLAFYLSYFEHGNCVWMLKGGSKDMFGGDWRWDGVDTAGILIWEHKPSEIGGKTYEKRAEDAAHFLEEYTSWCNGECYCYSITETIIKECGHEEEIDHDSCGGYIGMDYMLEEIADRLKRDDEITVTFEGRNEGGDIAGKLESLVEKKEKAHATANC